MNAHERQLVLHELTTSQSHLLVAVADLTPQQWHFHEQPDRWSIAENIEHLDRFECFINGAIHSALFRPAEPEKQSQVVLKLPQVQSLSSAQSRLTRITAREAARPTGLSHDPAALLHGFRQARAATMTFASQTQTELRHHFFPHLAFGDLDCYQWLLLLSHHTERHILQIQQIEKHPAYPSGDS